MAITSPEPLQVEIYSDFRGYESYIGCMVIVPTERVAPKTITLKHKNTRFTAKAYDTSTTSAEACTDSIHFTDLYNTPTKNEEGGIDESARIAERRYRKGSHCKVDSRGNTDNIDRTLELHITPVTHYDKDEWVCEAEAGDDLEGDTYPIVIATYDRLVTHQIGILASGASPELITSFHRDVGLTEDDKKYDKASIGCKLVGYSFSSSLGFTADMSPSTYTSMVFDQEGDGSGLELVTGQSWLTSDLYGRNRANGSFDTAQQLFTSRSTGDYLCYSYDSVFDRDNSFSDKTWPFVKQEKREHPKKNIEKYTRTVCFDNWDERINEDWRPSAILRHEIPHPFDTAGVITTNNNNKEDEKLIGTDFIMTGGSNMIDFLPVSRRNEGRLEDYAIIFNDGTPMHVIDNECPGPPHCQGDEGWPEEYNVFELMDDGAVGDGTHGLKRVVIKMPEQVDLKPVRLLTHKIYTRTKADQVTPLPKVPIYFYPSRSILLDWYRNYGQMLIDYERVSIKRIRDKFLTNNDAKLSCGDGTYPGKVMWLSNGACKETGINYFSPVTGKTNGDWCNEYNSGKTDQKGYWTVKTKTMVPGDVLRIIGRSRGWKFWDEPLKGLPCLFRTYVCAERPREPNSHPMNSEVIIVEPEVPYDPNYKVHSVGVTLNETECIPGDAFDEYADVFEDMAHKYEMLHDSSKNTALNYNWGHNLARDLMYHYAVGSSPNSPFPVSRLPYENYKKSWGTEAQPKSPCHAAPSTCENYKDTYNYGGTIPDLVSHNELDAVALHRHTVSGSQDAWLWCQVDGVRSPKRRPHHLFEDYIFRSDRNAFNGGPIVAHHLNQITKPIITAARGSGDSAGFTLLTCKGVPFGATDQVQTVTTMRLVAEKGPISALGVKRENVGGSNANTNFGFEYKWYNLTNNHYEEGIMDRNANHMNFTSYNLLLDTSEMNRDYRHGEYNLAVWFNTSILEQLDYILCDYGYLLLINSGPFVIKELLGESQSVCKCDDYEVNIVAPNPRLISCTVSYNFKRGEYNSTCREPVVHLYAVNNGTRLPMKTLCDYNYISSSYSPRLTSASKMIEEGDSYCMYEDDTRDEAGQSITAVLSVSTKLVPMNVNAAVLYYYCSATEHSNNIVIHKGPKMPGQDVDQCILPPLYFIPDIKVVENNNYIDTTVIECSMPRFLNGTCFNRVFNSSLVVTYSNSLNDNNKKVVIGWLNKHHNDCVIHNDQDVACEMTEDGVLRFMIEDELFYALVGNIYIDVRFHAVCLVDPGDDILQGVPLDKTRQRVMNKIRIQNNAESNLISLSTLSLSDGSDNTFEKQSKNNLPSAAVVGIITVIIVCSFMITAVGVIYIIHMRGTTHKCMPMS